ncbi:DEP domain-containing protein DDB_G0279099 [Lucilia cuprina]|uniref:DEP domain-containing protein DDB_G0279099 n=1 Tax=Lucilia cuprina TaxID=7375 RepID=UPI001F0673C6|nr:DEP domain-containing protein DDB_G0279099 [Lucilia cuprina]
MRDYPTVPNVFRVASSHSVDTDCATSSAGGCDIKITSGTNANLPTGQLRQQQQQLQQKQLNGNISGQQQSLVKSCISSQTTTTAKTSTSLSQTTTTQASTTAVTTKCTSSTLLKTKRPQCPRTSQYYLQQSPYATLPRNTASSLSTLSLVSAANATDGDIRKQQRHNSNNSNNNSHSNTNNTHQNNSNEPTMLGVINTISGSIPSTGYTMESHQLPTNKTNSNGAGSVGGIGHRTISMASDLNAGMNNSCTNLSKLNGVQQKNIRLQQQQQHQQSTHQHHDFKQTATITPAIDDFTTYRRQYPCSSLERNANGYLWIITPVAASISVAIVIAALAGPQWLFTEEKLPNTLYNGTANFNVLDDGAFITRYTKSSLWIICTTLQDSTTKLL